MSDENTVGDPLRPVSEVLQPDVRMAMYSTADPKTLAPSQVTLEIYHSWIAEITLDDSVPTEVRQHFETGRNIFLYTWFVYRFHQVAELWIYACLEMALRKKTELAAPEVLKATPRIPLGRLIDLAISKQWVSNTGFSVWERHQRQTAYQRYLEGLSEEMRNSGATEVEIKKQPEDFDGVVADPNYDYLGILRGTIKNFRNNLAHGSSILHPHSLVTIRICAEFINQLFVKV